MCGRGSGELDQQSLAKNASLLALAQGLQFGMPVLLLPFLATTLGTEGFGFYGFCLSLLQISFILTDFGANLHGTAEVVRRRAEGMEIGSLAGSIYVVKLTTTMVVIIVLVALAHVVPSLQEFSLPISLLAGAVVFQAAQPIWLFQGLERMGVVAAASATQVCVAAAVLLTMVDGRSDYLALPAAWALGQLAALLVYGARIYNTGIRIGPVTLGDIVENARKMWHFFVSRLALTVYSAGSGFLLGVSGLMSELALFTIADQLYRAVRAVFYPIVQTMYPYMTRTANFQLLWRIVASSTALTLILVLILIWNVDWLLTYFAGDQFAGASDAIIVLSVAALIAVPAMYFGYPALSALDRNAAANNSVIAGSLVFCVLILVLMISGNLTALGCAGAILVTEAIVLSYRAVALANGWRAQRS